MLKKLSNFVLLAFAQIVYSACSDLGHSVTFSRMCYDGPLTCSQFSYTLSGTYCTGGLFTSILEDFRCNSATTRNLVTSSSCQLSVGTAANCFSPTQTYATATVSGVYFIHNINTPCYSTFTQTMFEVIVFGTGSVNGVIATQTTTTTTTTTTASPSASASLSSVNTQSVNSGGDNTVVIIVAVLAVVIVAIVGIVGFLVVRNIKKQSAPATSSPQQFNQQAYQPYQPYPPPQHDFNRESKVGSTIYPNNAQYSPPPMSPEIQAVMLAPVTTMPELPPKY